MKSKFFSVLALLFFVFAAIAVAQDSTTAVLPAAESEIKVATQIDKKTVPLNRTVVLRVTLSWLGDPDRYEITDFENPALTNFDIIGTATANKTEVVRGKTQTRREYEFTLKPRELGMGYVEGVVVKYKDRVTGKERSLVTNRIGIQVTDAVAESEAATNWPATILIIAIIIILAGIIWFFLIYKKSRGQAVEPEIISLIEETYLSKLKELIDFNKPDLKNDFGRLGKFLRSYLAEKFQLPAKQATTSELIEEMKRRNLDERLVFQTNEVLGVVDAILFSGGEGSREELERVYGTVEGILERHLHEAKNAQGEEEHANK